MVDNYSSKNNHFLWSHRDRLKMLRNFQHFRAVGGSVLFDSLGQGWDDLWNASLGTDPSLKDATGIRPTLWRANNIITLSFEGYFVSSC